MTYNQVLEGIPRSYILDFFCGGAAEKNNSRSDQPIPGPHPMRGGAAAKNLKLNLIHTCTIFISSSGPGLRPKQKRPRRADPDQTQGGPARPTSRGAQGSPRGRRRRYLESKRRSVAASPTRQRTRWAYLDHNSGGAEAEKTVDQTQGEPISGLWGWAGGGI